MDDPSAPRARTIGSRRRTPSSGSVHDRRFRQTHRTPPGPSRSRGARVRAHSHQPISRVRGARVGRGSGSTTVLQRRSHSRRSRVMAQRRQAQQCGRGRGRGARARSRSHRRRGRTVASKTRGRGRSGRHPQKRPREDSLAEEEGPVLVSRDQIAKILRPGPALDGLGLDIDVGGDIASRGLHPFGEKERLRSSLLQYRIALREDMRSKAELLRELEREIGGADARVSPQVRADFHRQLLVDEQRKREQQQQQQQQQQQPLQGRGSRIRAMAPPPSAVPAPPVHVPVFLRFGENATGGGGAPLSTPIIRRQVEERMQRLSPVTSPKNSTTPIGRTSAALRASFGSSPSTSFFTGGGGELQRRQQQMQQQGPDPPLSPSRHARFQFHRLDPEAQRRAIERNIKQERQRQALQEQIRFKKEREMREKKKRQEDEVSQLRKLDAYHQEQDRQRRFGEEKKQSYDRIPVSEHFSHQRKRRKDQRSLNTSPATERSQGFGSYVPSQSQKTTPRPAWSQSQSQTQSQSQSRTVPPGASLRSRHPSGTTRVSTTREPVSATTALGYSQPSTSVPWRDDYTNLRNEIQAERSELRQILSGLVSEIRSAQPRHPEAYEVGDPTAIEQSLDSTSQFLPMRRKRKL